MCHAVISVREYFKNLEKSGTFPAMRCVAGAHGAREAYFKRVEQRAPAAQFTPLKRNRRIQRTALTPLG